MSSGGDTNVLSVISTDGSTSWQIVVALLASSVGFIVAIVNSIAAYFRDKAQMREIEEQDRRLKAFQKELEDKQRRLVRFENVKDLMKQYKKPLLQSAFDLQSRLANQIKSNFLYSFAQKGVERDLQYAKLNMAYVISEFLGWLEVIRQEIVFIVGEGNETTDLNLLIDAIKFQFTGETEVQGKHHKGEEHWKVLQLYAGELRAIGEVMILERTYEDRSMLSVIGYAEFVRRQTRALKQGASAEEESAWEASPEKLQQDTLKPLSDYIEQLVGFDLTATPKQRMTILQVLLCKLIDVLDNANPYEVGPEYDLENNDEPRYLARDFRLTPLVALLTDAQKKWLVNQRFMVQVHTVDQQAWADWQERSKGLTREEAKVYYRLAFPGFREDAHHDSTTGAPLTQAEREGKLGKDGFRGAFPPRQPRPRDKWWWAALNPEDVVKWREDAKKKGRTVVPPPSGLQQMASFKRGGKDGSYSNKGASANGGGGGGGGGGGPLSWLRNRRRTASVKPEPESMDYALGLEEGSTRPDYGAAILTSPSQHTLRSTHPSMQSLAGESRKELAESQPAASTAPPTSPPASTATTTALQPLVRQHSAEDHPHPHHHQHQHQQAQQRQQQSVLQPPPPSPPPLPEAEPSHLVTSIAEEMAALAAESSQPGQVPGAAQEAAKVRPTTPQGGASSVRSSAGL